MVRTRHGHHNGVTNREVRGATDNLTQLCPTRIDTTQSQTIGIRMLLEVLDATNHEILVIAGLVWGTGPKNRFDLKP